MSRPPCARVVVAHGGCTPSECRTGAECNDGNPCADETCMVSALGTDDGECRYMAWDARCAPGEVCVPHQGCVVE